MCGCVCVSVLPVWLRRYQPDGTCNDDDDTSAMLAARRAAFERRDTRDAIIRADDLAGTQAPAPRDGRVHIARFRSFDAYVLPFDGFAIGIRCVAVHLHIQSAVLGPMYCVLLHTSHRQSHATATCLLHQGTRVIRDVMSRNLHAHMRWPLMTYMYVVQARVRARACVLH